MVNTGDRIELVHTVDLEPFSDGEDKDRRIQLAIGDRGIVNAIHSGPAVNTKIYITWDSGERSCLHPHRGDVFNVLSLEDL